MKNSKAILKTPGTMKIIAADIPVPKEHEVLIKIEYVAHRAALLQPRRR